MSTPTSPEMPTKLNPSKTHYALVSLDKLSVKYNSLGSWNIGASRANKPVTTASYYFEMRVKNTRQDSNNDQTSIGFSTGGFDFRDSLGCGKSNDSVGYHGDDGSYYGKDADCPGLEFTTNDIVGAGIDYPSEEFFFTKNGVLIGTLSLDIDDPLYPTVGVHGEDAEVEVNFGSKPFAYDVKTRYPDWDASKPNDNGSKLKRLIQNFKDERKN